MSYTHYRNGRPRASGKTRTKKTSGPSWLVILLLIVAVVALVILG
jgi:hypothetical protein